jgi:diacylglycerol kinase (ATP)
MPAGGKTSLPMNMCVILNPNAGGAAQATVLQEALAHQANVTLHVTRRKGEAKALAAAALQASYDIIVAAGGDGTIHEVVNGLATDFTRTQLGIIPLGTGNDLARTLAIPLEPLEALSALTGGTARWLDLIRVETVGRVIYGINMAIGGFTGQMNEVLTDERKRSWGPLAYLLGATQVVPDLTTYKTIMTCDSGPVERIDAFNIAVANGRTAAGGFQVVPQANPEDGLLDLVLIRYVSLAHLAEVTARFVAGTYLENEHVLHRRVCRLRIYSRPGMWFNVDGELFTKEPVTFTIQPRALRVMVGPHYTPRPGTA